MHPVKSNRPYFIISCARSGSTSLARILDMASNGVCAMEPAPNLNVETRKMMDKEIDDPRPILNQTVFPRVYAGMKKYGIYGEKNVTYGPFIPWLYEEFECRFVFLIRDGRDVVRSLMDWHNRKFGTIYRECMDPGELTPEALSFAANLPVHMDSSDFSRPRPLPDEPVYGNWENMSRFEMCAYYWQRINNLYLDQLENLPSDAWVTIDYTAPIPKDVERVSEFLGLEGIAPGAIADILEQRINSLRQRGVTDGKRFPAWSEWPVEYTDMFKGIAGEAMNRLGYAVNIPPKGHVSDNETPEKESNFGTFWKTHTGGEDWYVWMYNHRTLQHQAFQKWFQFIRTIEPIDSVADFGCGTGVGYRDFFEDLHFVGIDLAPQLIDWCNKRNRNPKHAYRVLEFIESPPDKEFDLVFSQGTIDNAYDMNEFLRSAVKAARKWIYITAYRGFFAEIGKHRYTFNPEQGVYYNDLSPAEAHATLQQAGCSHISVFPSPTGYEEIPFETVIIAHV